MSILDDIVPGIVSDVLNLGIVDTTATFKVRSAEHVDPEAGELRVTETNTDVQVSPPQGFSTQFIDGERVKVGDKTTVVPASGLTFELKANMELMLGGETWTVVTVKPISTGDSVAAYKMQIRRKGT